MFSLLNTSNNIDLSQGKNFLQVNKNNQYKMIPNLDLIGGNNNVGSIVEAMSAADSTQAKNTVTANNVSKLNDEFNQIMIEYIKNYQLLIEQVLKNQSNHILQKYAGKNVKLQGSDNEIFYVNKFGFLQKYKNFGKRPLSCGSEPVEIPPTEFIKFPKGQDMPSGMDCGLEGNNIEDKTTGQFSWINITGERFNYPKDLWDKRSQSCKEAYLKHVNHSNIVGLASSGDLKEDSMCNRLNADPKLLENVQKLNKKLTTLGEELLIDIAKLSVNDIQTQKKLDETRNKIHESLAKLKKENSGLENGDFEISSTFNPNLEELRLDTGLRATSNFTRYLIFLIIAVLLVILTVYTLSSNNNNILAQGIIALVCIYAIYLFLHRIYKIVF